MEKLQFAENEKWYDWKWQLLNSITTVEELATYLPYLRSSLEDLRWVTIKYHLRVTPYYLSLVDPENPDDPVARQIVPSTMEIEKKGDPDPYKEDNFSPLPHVVHRYPDRVLLLATNICPSYCRHCMRKRLWRKKGYVLRGSLLDAAVEYISSHKEVKDVLITGGEPLILRDEEIEEILKKLKAIPHVKIIRIGSRVPVTLPMRLTEELGRIFERYAPVYINTHFNHPAELTDLAKERIKDYLKYGVIWGNQTVLLLGVNDNSEILSELFYSLAEAGVRPYYLFQCDPVEGVSHFRVPLKKALKIYEEILKKSGMIAPKFAIDLPEGGGKVILAPEKVVKWEENGVMVESYEGRRIFYPGEG